MRIFGGDRIKSVMNRLKVDDDMPIENRMISRSLEGAQKKVEGFHFDQRKSVVQYDDVMNRHRKAVYAMRREILKSDDISKRVKIFIEEESKSLATSPEAVTEQFDDIIRSVFGFDEKLLDKLFDSDADKFAKVLKEEALKLYKDREKTFGGDILRKVERDIYLQVLDNLWMQHLENMDHLREGIHWMSVGQQDPLVEYRRRGQLLFEEMQASLRNDVLMHLFHAEPISQEDLDRATDTELTLAARSSVNNASQILNNENEFDEGDFKSKKVTQPKKKQATTIKKARKTERKRKTVAKRRRK
jgi:preprotein translocase subunit SecA